MATEFIAHRITDIQFDWYARLLPGAIAVVFYFHLSGERPDYSASMLFACGAVAYLLGHAAQPLSGLLVGWLQTRVDRAGGGAESRYREYNQRNGRDHLSSVVLKAHAEATCMSSAAVLVPCVMAYVEEFSWLGVGLAVYFALMTAERVFARHRKISHLPALPSPLPPPSPSQGDTLAPPAASGSG